MVKYIVQWHFRARKICWYIVRPNSGTGGSPLPFSYPRSPHDAPTETDDLNPYQEWQFYIFQGLASFLNQRHIDPHDPEHCNTRISTPFQRGLTNFARYLFTASRELRYFWLLIVVFVYKQLCRWFYVQRSKTANCLQLALKIRLRSSFLVFIISEPVTNRHKVAIRLGLYISVSCATCVTC